MSQRALAVQCRSVLIEAFLAQTGSPPEPIQGQT